jgi:translation initiation factor IF-2
VDIRTYDIIYRLTEDIEKALKGMLEPEKRKVELGRAEVRQVFRIPKLGNIAGCMVLKGEVRRNASARVVRGGEVVHEGSISSLRHIKDDVRDVREGFECGIGLRGFDGFKVGDMLEIFTEEQVPAE